eukprot:tig00000194_g14773.t1
MESDAWSAVGSVRADPSSADPSCADGSRVVYDREVPFELRSPETLDGTSDVGALEAVRVKILINDSPNTCRIELTSENDLFFHFTSSYDEAAFRVLSERQKLMVDWVEFPNLLFKMLNACIKEPHTHLAVFVISPQGGARLDFIQNMEYKFVELLSMDFFASSDDIVRAAVTWRYNTLKNKLAILQARLQDVNNLVKIKSPSLLLQLQKTPPKLPKK